MRLHRAGWGIVRGSERPPSPTPIRKWLGSSADLQFVHALVEPLNTHRPRKPKEPNSLKDCPSMGLNYAISRGNLDEWVQFGLIRNHSARPTTPIFSNDTIKNKHWYSVFLSLNNVPNLCNSFVAGSKVGHPTRKWGAHVELGGVPRFRSRRTDIFKTPLGGERAHRPRPKHVDGVEYAKDQRNHCKYLERIVQYHSSNSDGSHESCLGPLLERNTKFSVTSRHSCANRPYAASRLTRPSPNKT